MTALRNPDTGSIIQATGGLETRLIDQGWVATDQPPAPGLRIVTAAELEALTTTVQTTIGPIAQQLPEVVSEVDQLIQTVEATSTQAAPKATPRTDALELWRATAEPALAAIDVPAEVDAWLTANPPPAGSPGADGKSAYQIARDHGYGGTETQWLASLKGETGATGAASTVPGPKGDTGNTGPPGTTDYTQLTNRPTLHAVAMSGAYADLTGKPSIPAAVEARKVIQNTAALTANTVKAVAVTWPTAMPNATYAVTAMVESNSPHTVAIGVTNKTTTGCTLQVRSTAAVGAGGLNISVIAVA